MLRELAKSIREYKHLSIWTPILVSGEVVMECIIPFVIANLVNEIKAGCSMGTILSYGLVLLVMALLSSQREIAGYLKDDLSTGRHCDSRYL